MLAAAALLAAVGALTPPARASSSWLRVSVPQRAGAPAIVEHGWVRTPPVSLEALFGTNRVGVAVGPHTMWFEYELHADTVAHARTREDLRHAVDVRPSGSYHTIAVSADVGDALRAASLHGLRARVRAIALQRSDACAARIGDDPGITDELARCVARQALAQMGVVL